MGRQIDAKQWDSYNETYSTLKTEYEGWSSRRRLGVRRWVLGPVFPLSRTFEWIFGRAQHDL
jgi:hypothetical protein